jgi:hypothetical protein
MTLPALEFDIISEHGQYRCNDWINNRNDLGLSVDKLEVGQKFKNKFECINIIKC